MNYAINYIKMAYLSRLLKFPFTFTLKYQLSLTQITNVPATFLLVRFSYGWKILIYLNTNMYKINWCRIFTLNMYSNLKLCEHNVCMTWCQILLKRAECRPTRLYRAVCSLGKLANLYTHLVYWPWAVSFRNGSLY